MSGIVYELFGLVPDTIEETDEKKKKLRKENQIYNTIGESKAVMKHPEKPVMVIRANGDNTSPGINRRVCGNQFPANFSRDAKILVKERSSRRKAICQIRDKRLNPNHAGLVDAVGELGKLVKGIFFRRNGIEQLAKNRWIGGILDIKIGIVALQILKKLFVSQKNIGKPKDAVSLDSGKTGKVTPPTAVTF